MGARQQFTRRQLTPHERNRVLLSAAVLASGTSEPSEEQKRRVLEQAHLLLQQEFTMRVE